MGISHYGLIPNEKKRSYKSVMAVLDWISHLYNKQKGIEHESEELFYQDEKQRLSQYDVYSPSINHLIERMTKVRPGLIVFVDIENHYGMLPKLVEYSKDLWGVHLILAASKHAFYHKFHLIDGNQRFSFIRTKTTSKNAADTLLTMIMTSMNILITIKTKFILVSNDDFIGEVCKNIQEFNGRKCISCKFDELIEILDKEIWLKR